MKSLEEECKIFQKEVSAMIVAELQDEHKKATTALFELNQKFMAADKKVRWVD